ncbi:MAG: formyltransferase family protein [Dissulfuribacterales bacterium]
MMTPSCQNGFGWWTTGRDQAAIDLLLEVKKAVGTGLIPGRFNHVFCSKNAGEGPYSDTIMQLAQEAGIPTISLSAMGFLPELRKQNKDKWRTAYHQEILRLLGDLNPNFIVLAGYMWVVSPQLCTAIPTINLHPAEPGGPVGTWQEVVWQLISKQHKTAGAMMHLVTPELDRGPAITYCSFPITGSKWQGLWEHYEQQLRQLGEAELQKIWRENLPLFAEIRKETVKREIPLIIQTIKAVCEGNFPIQEIHKGAPVSPLNLSIEIENQLLRHSIS